MEIISEKDLQSAIGRHQQKVYAFVLNLIQGNRDEVYKITVSSFAESTGSVKRDDFLSRVLAIAFASCRQTKVIPEFDDYDFEDIKDEEKQSLLLVNEALGKLSFDERALLLLRDQINLSYRQIGEILQFCEKDAKSNCLAVRVKLRESLEEVLKKRG